MPINVFGEGAVQTAYVGYRSFGIAEDTQLFWPNAFQDTADVAAAYMKVVAAAGPFNLILPDATQVSVGQNFIITNAGVPQFILLNFAGVNIGAIEDGVLYYYILEDNSTSGGVWRRTTFGAGTSQADAAELAGMGLVANNDRLDTNVEVVSTAGPVFNVDDTNNANLIVWTGGAGQINLPAVGTVPAGYYCSYNNEGTGEVIVRPNTPGETIDGLNQLTLGLGQSVTIITDHVKWYSLGFGKQTFSAVSILQKTVSGNVNITLAPDEATKNIIQFNGLLTGNITVFFPVIVGEWNLFNHTTGAFSLNVRLAGPLGTSYVIPPGGRQIFYSDGSTSLFDIPTVINVSTATFPSGDAANPGIAFTDGPTTGFFYNNGTPDLGVSVGGVEIANFQASGEVLAPAKTLALKDSTAASTTTLSTNIAYSQIASLVGGNTSTLRLTSTSATAAKISLLSPGTATLDLITDGTGAHLNYVEGANNGTAVLGGNTTSSALTIYSTDLASPALSMSSAATSSAITYTNTGNSCAFLLNVGVNSATFQWGLTTGQKFAVNVNNSTNIATLGMNATAMTINNTGDVAFSNPISIVSGGTGASNAPVAARNLLPVSVNGAMMYFNGGLWNTLAPGADGTTLKMVGGIPTWTP